MSSASQVPGGKSDQEGQRQSHHATVFWPPLSVLDIPVVASDGIHRNMGLQVWQRSRQTEASLLGILIEIVRICVDGSDAVSPDLKKKGAGAFSDCDSALLLSVSDIQKCVDIPVVMTVSMEIWAFRRVSSGS